ncbi:thioredoxin family protein [Lutibacter sp. TH_r2]|uniref:thioredoxin family protein n=1 Tax=Lutibacter sp. TH_r2 TaxID=3082083 RepID=UPI0029547E81|nr:thioredoxin family protein [Lutibacter sp. TH_r2]MDV7187007.1 thioredoxin family protein [Lutibacter sp. TH_r2]
MLKKIILSFTFIFTTFISFSQNWITSINEAKEIASKDGKKIVLVFQGSDWCAPCIKLDVEIWSTEEFKSYAAKNFVMLKADFPRKKKNELSPEQQKQNNKLMEKYNTKGYFPFVVVLDKDANVLGKTGYKKTTPKNYISLLSSL